MSDDIDTSTEGVAETTKRLKRLPWHTSMSAFMLNIAALLDALARERDRATLSTISEGYLDVLVPSLSGARPVDEIAHRNERAERIAAEIVNLRRERDEARRMLERYGVHSPRCAKNRWPKAGETFAECDCGYDRAREAGKETA